MNPHIRLAAFAAAFTLLGSTLHAQVPQLINCQGRVVVGTTNFNGTGQFKFALVNTNGSTTYWSNDGTSAAGSQPTNAVALTVSSGLYSVLLGDATLPNMTAIPSTVFNNADVRLRVWFNDGTNGSQLLTPDQRIAAVGYAMMAGNVPDGVITTNKISGGAVTSAKIDGTTVQQRVTGTAPAGSFITGINQNGTVTTAADNVGSGDITGVTAGTGLTGGGSSGDVTVGIAAGGVTATQLANGAVGTNQLASAAVSETKIGAGQVVKSLNSLKDSVTLAGSSTVTVTPTGGNALTFAAGPFSLNGTTAYYNAGLVGIGTNTPPATFPSKLTIQAPSGNSYGFEHTDGTVRLCTYLGGSSSTGGWLGTISAHKLNFFTNNGGAAMTIDTDNDVGIGTSTPTQKLEVTGNSQINGQLFLNAPASGNVTQYIKARPSDGFPFLVQNSSGADVFYLIVGIGNPNTLVMTGDAFKTSGGTSWSSPSDRRLKQNVRSYEAGLDQILKLRSVRFRYRDGMKPGFSSNQEEFGFIAQEVQKIIPEAVAEGTDGYLTLKADPIHWAAINAIQELNTKLGKQRDENATLREETSALKHRIAELEAKDTEREARLTKIEQSLSPAPRTAVNR